WQGAGSASFDSTFFRVALQTSGNVNHDRAEAGTFYGSLAKTFNETEVGASGYFALRPLAFWYPGNDPTYPLLEFYAQVSSTYRNPTLYERFGDNVFVTPSEKLKSEKAITNAGGVRGSFMCFKNLSCSWRTEAFLTGAHYYIIFTQNSSRTLIAVNASRAQILGIENEVLLNWPERFLLTLRYTYLDARDYGNIPYYQDKFLPMRPRHHAVGVITVPYRAFRFMGSVEYRGAVFRDRYNSYSFYLASKTLVDAGVDLILDSYARHVFNFTVKNIFDDQEVDMIGYTLPGRYFLVKWTAAW
ncbi:MAG TPA: hypothetical protein PLY93_08360, partial [Turneriella sp.]|nr:hypothetical protein [Turneriella sp.]